MSRDSYANTFGVAIGVCLVCSLLVTTAAVGLRSYQDKNRVLDVKKNIVKVAGFTDEAIRDAGGVEKIFADNFEQTIINLETGEDAVEELQKILKLDSREEALKQYDQFKAAKTDPEKDNLAVALDRKEDLAGLGKTREKFSFVYFQKDEAGKVLKYILPIRGRGLWSTLKGFISLEPDMQTVAGITYYEHGETPGLGGEVDNAGWKAKWNGKKLYSNDGELDSDGTVPDVELKVVKGQSDSVTGVDGLAGATITSRGVSDMITYWLGEKGFGPYIAKQKQIQSSQPVNAKSDNGGASDG